MKYSYFILALFLFLMTDSCKKKDDAVVVQETGTVTDIDNTVYKTVKIGSQWWMAEDLNVRRYRNGDYIIQIQSDTVMWSNDTTGAYCDSKDNQGNSIGKYYNWYAVNNSKNIAPNGWHIPTDNEWKELEKYIGMNPSDADKTNWRGTNEGDKLKIQSSLSGWTVYENVWGTNESGFTAIGNGCRLFNGNDGDPGIYSTEFWWTQSGDKPDEAWYRYLDYKNSNVFRSHTYKNFGFSVRCVKD